MITIKNADIIEGVATKIVAHDGYKITNKEMSLFTNVLYPKKGYFDNDDNPQGYRAVPESIYKMANEQEEHETKTKSLENQVDQLTALVQSLLERVPE